jgi:hypothetical protein
MTDEIKDKLYEREVEFVKTESDFINGGLSHTKEVAQAMAQDHRYLVQERFKLTLEYWKELAKNYRKGRHDPRNEWACKTASVAINALIESGDLYIPFDEREDFGLPKAA